MPKNVSGSRGDSRRAGKCLPRRDGVPADGRGRVAMTRISRAFVGAAALALASLGGARISEAGGAKAAEAQRRLSELAKEATLGGQAANAQADAYYESARRAYEALDYERALDLLKKALEANPAHDKARELAQFVQSLLGVRPDWIRAGLENLSREKQVQIQESLMELQRAIQEGIRHKRNADAVQPGDAERAKDALLSRQIGDLNKAMEQFKRVLEIIRWMPYELDLSNEEKQVKGLLQECQNSLKAKEEELRVFRRQKAAQQVEARKSKELTFQVDRLNQLLGMARVQFERARYEECEDICNRVLEIDPLNREAKALVHQARQKRHEYREDELYEQTRHERRGTMLMVEETAIPYTERIRYPANWDKILRRVEKAGKIDQAEEPEWAQEIRRKLDRKVSFEFIDTPLREAVAFLQTLTKVNMILDPKAVEAKGDVPINLKVANMSLQLALDWILKLADLDYVLRDSAIFISTRENLKGDVVLRIYDVRDLTENIPDFPSPELQLQVGPTTAAAGAGGAAPGIILVGGEKAEEVTVGSLAEMIQQRVRPGEWAAELGTSIEERGGKLVVMQRPEVHRLIDKLLESFRASQKLLVTVEARFLEIREGFFEEIGIDWGRVPDAASGNYLPGTGEATPGGGGGWPAANQNVLAGGAITSDTLTDPIFPGIVPQAQNVNIFGDGVMHAIGAVANYRPNVSPEQTQIGSRRGTTGSNLEEGLNAQVRFVGDVELLAFLHALKVREVGTMLSAPRLTVFNTQRAHMFVATQRSYIADYEISGDAYDPVIRQFLQGVVFDVKPIVSADRRYITLELRPTTAELVEMQQIIINAWSVLSGQATIVVTGNYPIQFPILRLRRVRTTVTIPDGGIIMLGGMMTDIKFQSETGVPFLSSIPIVGKLFRWNITDNERSNLSILVTGRILLFEEEEKKLH